MSSKETVEITTETSSIKLAVALNQAVQLYVEQQPEGTPLKIKQAGAFGIQAGFGAALISMDFNPGTVMEIYQMAKTIGGEGDCDCDNCTKKQEESKECKEK